MIAKLKDKLNEENGERENEREKFQQEVYVHLLFFLADLTTSKSLNLATEYKFIFTVFNNSFSFMKLAETLRSCLVKRISSLPEI